MSSPTRSDNGSAPSTSFGPNPKKRRTVTSRFGAVSGVTELKEHAKNLPPLGDHTNREYYFWTLLQKSGRYLRRRGGPEFMEDFLKGEKLHFSNGKTTIERHENGHNWREKIGNLTHVHLFESKDGLEMEIPDELDWENIFEFIEPEQEVSVAYSDKKHSIKIKMSQLVEAFKKSKEERPDILNMISLEFTRGNHRLDTIFKVPAFVDQKSIVQLVERALKIELEVLDQKLNGEISEEEKIKIKKERGGIFTQIQKLPRYQKFLLMSMEGSFTDVHIDFSSTCVFYHVKKGRKVFYVAKLTPQNWKIYQDFEKNKSKRSLEWIGEKLSGEWERVEIKEGETAMIPSGYLHFVYTPVDSIVIGGNFLMEQSLQNQFDLTELEEWCVAHKTHIGKEHTFVGFRGLMWEYMKHVLAPRLAANPDSEFLNEAAHICLEKMNPKKAADPIPPSERDAIVRRLLELVKLPKRPPHGPTVDTI